MDKYTATELAFKHGYGKGYEDAIAFAKNELKPIKESVKECLQKGKALTDFETDNNVGSKWIPVSERLPEEDSDVLAYLRIGEEGRIYPANYAKGMWFDCIFNTPATNTTTHWMPLPEPPKEGE